MEEFKMKKHDYRCKYDETLTILLHMNELHKKHILDFI